MSGLWTPGSDQPVGGGASEELAGGLGGPGARQAGEPSEAELEAQMEALRRELADTPAAVVVANHCFGLFQLAALHLSFQPPKLEESQLAIDALGALVEGLAGRLGPEEQQLKDGLAQLRLAFVQIKSAIDQPG